MADDNSYMSFLEKANQPLTGYSTASKIETPAEKKLKTLDAGLAVPKAIQSALDKEPVFVSDADELFEGVSLKWDKDELPTAGRFSYHN